MKVNFDLHNNFDFVGFAYNVADREIKLHWRKSSGEWVDRNELSSLVLTHSAVTFLNVIDQDEKSTYDDDSCLGEITFSGYIRYFRKDRTKNKLYTLQSCRSRNRFS